jgi:hypothetical protein
VCVCVRARARVCARVCAYATCYPFEQQLLQIFFAVAAAAGSAVAREDELAQHTGPRREPLGDPADSTSVAVQHSVGLGETLVFVYEQSREFPAQSRGDAGSTCRVAKGSRSLCNVFTVPVVQR